MICLSYFSTATGVMSAESLNDIVARAQAKNAANGVTGLLCHYGGSFLQFLEGDETSALAIFDKISRDPRHRDILEVYREPISERIFGDWAMAIVKPDDVGSAPQTFSRNLRRVQLAGEAKHRQALEPLLAAFRTWIR